MSKEFSELRSETAYYSKNREGLLVHTEEKNLVQIHDIPDIKGKYCTININITWDVAEKIVSFTAPLLKAIEGSVDTRTTKQIQQQNAIRILTGKLLNTVPDINIGNSY